MSNPFVLVHGGMTSSTRWAPLLPYLDRPHVAVDLPGRGRRPQDLATVTLDDCVAAVLEDADAAGFDRFCLVGLSMGGVTITETAFRHPERISALVYVAALVPAAGQSAAEMMGVTIEGDVLQPQADEAAARAYFAGDMTDEQWTEHWRNVVPDAASLLKSKVSGHATGIPVTYIGCKRDVPVPPALVERMLPNLWNPTFHELDCSHSVMTVKPKELAAILNDAAR